ncbi:hypothetical protein ACAG25_06615 [Mycobacterium sp. pV006]|uniref:hypothetical protein n=1 Tax=Mycobacterium sp. pV006 TaxID=3238983 RepID=UPI00351AB680
MTTAEHARDVTAPRAATVSVAGVPWPVYKVVALLVGFLTFALVAVIVAAPGPAVLTAAAVASVIWIGGTVSSSRH